MDERGNDYFRWWRVVACQKGCKGFIGIKVSHFTTDKELKGSFVKYWKERQEL